MRWNAAALALLLSLLVLQPVTSARAEQSFPADPELPIEARRAAPRPWRLTLATGFEYDSGIAGDTKQLFVPVSARIEYGSLALRVATSLVRIDGERIVRGTAPADADLADRSLDETGIGDTLLGLSYAWYDPDSALPFVEFGYSVKIPTGSVQDQIGTGEYDWILQLDLAKQLGRFTSFATIAYRFNGGPIVLHARRVPVQLQPIIPGDGTVLLAKARIPVHDTLEFTLGSSFRASDRLHAGLLYDFQQSPFDGVADDHELVSFASLELSRNVQFGPYFVIGLSDRAPDWGVATQLLITY